MTTYADYLKNRETTKLNTTAKLKSLNSTYEKTVDPRMWKPTVDNAGNAQAIIRFLPSLGDKNDQMLVKIYEHSFKGPTGSYYIEKSLNSLNNGKDPVAIWNRKMWETGLEENRKFVSMNTKRKTSFYANVYVIDDPAKPTNNGKVFIYKFGKKIYSKILEMNGLDENNKSSEDTDEDVVDVFDLLEGCNFKLVQRKKDQYPNFDSSKFLKQTAFLNGDEEALDKVFEQMHDLNDLIKPEEFKSYEELEKNFKNALGKKYYAISKKDIEIDDDDNDTNDDVIDMSPSKSSETSENHSSDRIKNLTKIVEETDDMDDDIPF